MSITMEERYETMTHLKRKQEDFEYELSLLNNADENFEITKRLTGFGFQKLYII